MDARTKRIEALVRSNAQFRLACAALVEYADTRQPDFIVISAQLTKAIQAARDALQETP
jgi:hypothetical protein